MTQNFYRDFRQLPAYFLLFAICSAQSSSATGTTSPLHVGDAIRNGAIWSFVGPEEPTLNTLEQFCSDGRWAEFGGRAPLYGTYTVQNDTVCVTRDGAEKLCRKVVKDGSDWRAEIVSGSGAPPVIAVQIKPETQCFTELQGEEAKRVLLQGQIDDRLVYHPVSRNVNSSRYEGTDTKKPLINSL